MAIILKENLMIALAYAIKEREREENAKDEGKVFTTDSNLLAGWKSIMKSLEQNEKVEIK